MTSFFVRGKCWIIGPLHPLKNPLVSLRLTRVINVYAGLVSYSVMVKWHQDVRAKVRKECSLLAVFDRGFSCARSKNLVYGDTS